MSKKTVSAKSVSKSNKSAEIFRGSSNIDLSKQGRAEARTAAWITRKQLTEIHASPLKRTQDTAREILRTNPQVGSVQTKAELEPWFLGEHEGQPVTPQRLSDIQDRMRNRPDEAVPGRGPRSTGDGESFNSFKNPLIELVIEELAFYRPGERILNVTHYRDVQAVKAWLAAGAQSDLSINTGVMIRKGNQKPGDLLRLNPETMKLTEVKDANADGIYFLRHGATEWNAENDGPSPNIEPDEDPQRNKPSISRADYKRVSDFPTAMRIYDAATPAEKQTISREARNKVFAARAKAWEWKTADGDPDTGTINIVRKYFPQAIPRPGMGAPQPIQ